MDLPILDNNAEKVLLLLTTHIDNILHADSDRGWLTEQRTVGMTLPRQSGKSAIIKNLARHYNDTAIIVDNHSRCSAYAGYERVLCPMDIPKRIHGMRVRVLLLDDVRDMDSVIGYAVPYLERDAVIVYLRSMDVHVFPESTDVEDGRTEINNCARCGGSHRVVFKKLARPMTESRHTHWALCPVTDEPILMRVIDIDRPVFPESIDIEGVV